MVETATMIDTTEFTYAARRSQQEAVAAINAASIRVAQSHVMLAVLHAARAASLIRA
ncbi:hypothetical protein Q5H91_03345 [Sphingomonas sp. KR1UV-12]|uniref:Uncharacterized protein n=1 Tax=Sphingomonas aurea TaxID=3063994 RepID=A0ABT9EHI5_9SPHN|nr:hypothetical protein [Sphingomonas sp. KR1UV-12]MDP1026236.1 hypothetical protein [Sphingomonas sp. KR1UV-12]